MDIFCLKRPCWCEDPGVPRPSTFPREARNLYFHVKPPGLNTWTQNKYINKQENKQVGDKIQYTDTI